MATEAWTEENEKAFSRRIGIMDAKELRNKCQELQQELTSGKDIVAPGNMLRIAVQEFEARGLGNPLATVTLPAPPPIPGVVATPVRQRPPAPPAPPKHSAVSQVGGPVPDPVREAYAPILPADRSCYDCPSFIASDDHSTQVAKFGKLMGVAMCSRLEIPLQVVGQDTTAMREMHKQIGNICEEYGRDPEGKNLVHGNKYLRTIARPADLNEVVGGYAPIADGKEPGSCTSCTFYSTPEVMLNNVGIPQGACTLTGKLIPLGKASQVARECMLNDQSEDFENSFGATFDWSKTALSAYRMHVTFVNGVPEKVKPAEVIDPQTYETDREVTDEDKEYGIRAWQKLSDPEPGSDKFVYMPIFNPESFSPEDRAKIPVAGTAEDDDHPELYQDHFGLLYTCMVLWTKLHETPALNGVAGTGKTAFFEYAAYRMGLPFERFSITNSTELDELQGRTTLVATETGNKTEFVYGRVALAWGKRCVLCIDEPNTGPNDVWQFFRPLTDNSKQLILDVNEGERLPRNKFCHMGMAFNPAWDVKNVGTHEIGDADGSRLMHIAVPMPSAEKEIEIIQRRCELDGYKIPPATLKVIMAVASELRDLAQANAFPVHWGIRNQLKVARATAWFSVQRSYRLAAGDLIDPDACEQLALIVKSHLPGDREPVAPTPAPRVRRGPGRPRKTP